MDQAQHSRIVSFIWGIADDVLRDLFKRGKYPDVILPMCVIRRMDAVLEPTKEKVLAMKKTLDQAGITEQRAALCAESGHAFYNSSPFTLKDLLSRSNQQQLRSDFEAYLNGFSPNVQVILENFKFRNQISTLSQADALGTLIAKFLSPEINLSPYPVKDNQGQILIEGLDNHSMGTIFEELVRKFNEANNEEAGEHWTPRDAVRLMANLIFLPIADQIQSGSYSLYDCAAGTGGMLTVAEETLLALSEERGKTVKPHLYGQEINPETFAICKADLLLKGEGENAENIVGGPEWSTLLHDAFPSREFDFMLANPPYGKSWSGDLDKLGGKSGMTDPRFRISHAEEADYSLVTRSSDGQMMFLANMVSKMNHATDLGSRIAEVHNGSSLFTGDAGSGESNIRRWIIENDWLEAIIALPLNMFYNTGIATYIWVITNRKPRHRKGKVQLIDATNRYVPLRKNLAKKNCELSQEDIDHICRVYQEFQETEESKIFDNRAFGFWKIVVERPLRLKSQFTRKKVESLRFQFGDEVIREEMYARFGEDLIHQFARIKPEVTAWVDAYGVEESEEEEGKKSSGLSKKVKESLLNPGPWKDGERLVQIGRTLHREIGEDVYTDHNAFMEDCEDALDKHKMKLKAPELKLIYAAMSWRDEEAEPVIKKVYKPGKAEEDALRGRFRIDFNGSPAIVEYESDSELRDTEQVPLLEEGGIEAFFKREVLPYTPDAWIDEGKTKIGYEVSFTRHFYKPKPLRTLEEILLDIKKVEEASEGFLKELIGNTK
ncbi:MAG: SAM-dependent DNA methyltransferase [Lewinellaceae bacterium]|nr:SAM-dependent DNA methyltransferase [Lewinellaceae bacterium]